MKKILIAYDGDVASRRALDATVEIATALHAEVTVVSVVPARPAGERTEPTPPWDNDAVHRRMVAEACEYLADRGVDAAGAVAVGDPSTEIDALAREGGFDTIIVGANTAHTVSPHSRPSVSADVARRAVATVVVAR